MTSGDRVSPNIYRVSHTQARVYIDDRLMFYSLCVGVDIACYEIEFLFVHVAAWLCSLTTSRRILAEKNIGE